MRFFQLKTQPFYRKVLRYELTADTPQDLYEKNYSTVKSRYGLDSLEDGTWTGLEIIDTEGSPATTIYTDTGEVLVDDDRYRDTRASLTLISIDTAGATLYTSPASGASTWLEVEDDYTLSRYVKSDIDATITIEVGPSLITAVYTEATILADLFPEWMEIRTDEDSHGFRLLNVMSQDVEEVKSQGMFYPNRSIIQLIPEGIKSYMYLSMLASEEDPIDVVGYVTTSPAEYYDLSPAEDLQEFVESEEEKHIYYKEGRYLFTSGEYEELYIDGELAYQEQVHLKNWFDYIGDYIALERLPEEENREYKRRILDVFINPPGASTERIAKAIERDSGCAGCVVWELRGGVLPWEEANDPGTSGVFYQEASEEHRDLAKWCNEQAAIGYDYFRWGGTLFDLYPHPWDLAELPYLLDEQLSDFSPALVRDSGIGYAYDLIAKPYEHKGTYPYSVNVKVRGFLETSEQHYPMITAWGKVVTSGTYSHYPNEFTGWICLECTTAGETYVMNLEILIPEDPYNASNTNAWQFIIPQFTSSMPLDMYVKTGDGSTSIQVAAENITQYQLYDGKWNFGTQQIDDNSPADELTLSFEPVEASPFYEANPWVVATAGEHPRAFYAEYETAVTVSDDAWEAEGIPFSLSCNPDQAQEPGFLEFPRFVPNILGLTGTMTYTLVPVSVSPDGAGLLTSPVDTTLEFWDLGTTPASSLGTEINGYPDNDVVIKLSSTYQEYATKYAPTIDDTTKVYAGYVSVEEPVDYHVITVSDFGLAGNFVDPKYEINATGEVLARLPREVGDTTDTLVVELNPDYMFQWPPKVAPGTLYLSGNEYYLHSESETESVSGTSYVLDYPIAPGAPLSFNEDLVEIHFTDDDGLPTLTITQEVQGNGTDYLPIWYDGAVSIEVDSVSKSLLNTNIIDYGSATDEDTWYTITYQVTDSYCVDYTWVESNEYRPKIYLQASHGGLEVTYTPYNEEGYWINTDIATNPVFTHKNRDFLYIDDETIYPDSVEILTMPPILYRDRDNTVLAIVKDANGNGVAGQDVTITTDDAQEYNETTNADGYVSCEITGPSEPTDTVDVTVTTDTSPAEYATVTYQLANEVPVDAAGLYLVEQSYQVAVANQSTILTLDLLLLDADGDPVQTSGNYTIWCSDATGNVGSTGINTDSTGVAVLEYTPSTVGRYVATITIGGETKYVGWEVVERI